MQQDAHRKIHMMLRFTPKDNSKLLDTNDNGLEGEMAVIAKEEKQGGKWRQGKIILVRNWQRSASKKHQTSEHCACCLPTFQT